MFSTVRPPYLLRRYYSRFTWSLEPDSKIIYLTFDDGPVPGVTDVILDILKESALRLHFFALAITLGSTPHFLTEF